MRIICILLIMTVSSCIGEDRFLIIRDTRYMEPQYRQDTFRYNKELFSLHRRYFVFNYSDFKEQFDSVATSLVCRSLNDSLLVTNVQFDFQDMGSQWGKYRDGDVLSADFTTPLVYFNWDISKPNIIVAQWGEYSEENQIIEFDCNLKQEYYKYIINE